MLITFIYAISTVAFNLFILWLFYKFIVFIFSKFKKQPPAPPRELPPLPWEVAATTEATQETEDKTERLSTLKPNPKIRRLKVPYAEKDLAKQFGARWDPHNKTWYITEQQSIMDMYFNGWYDLIPECGQDICNNCGQYALHFLDIEIHDNYECYKCHQTMRILLIFFPHGDDWNSDFRDMRPLESEFANCRPKDLISFAKHYDVLLATPPEQPESNFCYHICPHCHSIQGDYYIVEDLHQATEKINEFRASYCASCKQWEEVW